MSSPVQIVNSFKPPETSVIQVFVLILWLGCLVVGILGIVLSYGRPQPAAKPPAPIQAQLLTVQLSTEPVPPPTEVSPPPNPADPPPLRELMNVTQAPPLLKVAEPNPAIAFALPVAGPTQIVPTGQASHERQAPSVAPAPSDAPTPQTLTFGEGEGRQPAPDYPSRARREGQEGNVNVRFTVGEDGRVVAAEAATPSPWPLLNEAAVHTVRQRWKFVSGPVRIYEVSIRFQLRK